MSRGGNVKPGVPSADADGWTLGQTLPLSTVPLRKLKTSPGVEPGPKSQVLGSCQGLPVETRSLRFWFAVLAPPGPAPDFPLPHDSALAPVSIPPTHTPTSALCGLSKPSVDSSHFQTLLLPFFSLSSSSSSLLWLNTLLHIFPFLPVGLCWGEQLKVRKKPGFLG